MATATKRARFIAGDKVKCLTTKKQRGQTQRWAHVDGLVRTKTYVVDSYDKTNTVGQKLTLVGVTHGQSARAFKRLVKV